MLYHFLYPLRDFFFGFNVLRYITFRAAMAAIFAFLISVIIGPKLIAYLRQMKLHHSQTREGFQVISDKNPDKAITPTMGGILIVLSMLFSCLLWGNLENRFLWIALIGMVLMGLIGMADDMCKLRNRSSDGLLGVTKLTCQLAIGIALGAYLYLDSPSWTLVDCPFLKDSILPLGVFYVVFVAIVLSGASNAVNLTDGLDGLAIGCSVFIGLTYAIISYIAGHSIFANYLYITYVEGAGELTVFCASLVGAGLGFLWFNSHPATVFMGDTGSLSIGGAIGIVAILIKKEILLLIVGGIFVFEALSVMIQISSFKLRGKRVFLMAPIHHHFQLKGWDESKIVIRFWIVSIILCLIGLASLKLR